ncbi:MAG: hypothetical protein J6V36_03720 [Clostridia bacterium]|nr:hypothetical protein [Clostridia bacterium]
MAKKKNKSIWLVAPIIAIIFIIIAIVVILANGYRYTTYDDGSKFIGSVDNGQPISGKIKFSNGMTALIDYNNKKIEYSNGDVYIGDIKIIYRNGKGTLTFGGTKDIYEGEFKDNEISGLGKYTYSDGSVFEGSFLNGVKNGYGKFVSSSGETFSGTYSNDMRNGYGQYVSADESYKYSGNFVNNVQNGQGQCTYSNGDTYEGEFLNNERHGKGLYVWESGESYSGNFINGSRDTRVLDKNGDFALDQNGNYIHGEMATYTKKNGEIYTGYFENGYIKVIENESKD